MSSSELKGHWEDGGKVWVEDHDCSLPVSNTGENSGEAEPFGYFCECKGADPAFLRKPSWIPPTDALHTTTPLYAHPSQAEAALADIVRAWEALPGGQQQPMRAVEKWLADEMAPSINRIRALLTEGEAR